MHKLYINNILYIVSSSHHTSTQKTPTKGYQYKTVQILYAATKQTTITCYSN